MKFGCKVIYKSNLFPIISDMYTKTLYQPLIIKRFNND